MYHFYKIYGDLDYEERQIDAFKKEPHSITAQISTVVTFSPQFFRNELEIGFTALGIEEGDAPQWSDLMPLDALVINPLLDLLYEYIKLDKTGAKLAAHEMIEALNEREPCDDFPQRQIELIEQVTGIKKRPK